MNDDNDSKDLNWIECDFFAEKYRPSMCNTILLEALRKNTQIKSPSRWVSVIWWGCEEFKVFEHCVTGHP